MPSNSSGENLAVTDDESRLSRRSSVLVDILSLFRRSSSLHLRSQPKIYATDKSCGSEEEDEEESHERQKENILQAIKDKRDLIARLRSQPWTMARKRRTRKVAQRHLKRQEAQVTRMELIRAEINRRYTQFTRHFANFHIYLIPWEGKIKRIESHFGSVVSSYFTFLRWTLGVNIVLSAIMIFSVFVPEWLADHSNNSTRTTMTRHYKRMPSNETRHADELMTIVDLRGYFQYSSMFYGFYSNDSYYGQVVTYNVPLAYFCANIFILGFSFFLILRKMAKNARSSKMTSKTEQYQFCWKLFTGWDFTIGNSETSTNISMANVIKFREAIAEFNVNQGQGCQLYQVALRVFVNVVILGMLFFSVLAILKTQEIQNAAADPKNMNVTPSFFSQNAVAITISLITLIYPNIFDLLGKLEQYHPRVALRVQLARVLFLYIVNYYTLSVTLLEMFNHSDMPSSSPPTTPFYDSNTRFYQHFRQIREAAYIHSTVPAPTTPWTTVLPDFGPVGISAPRAVIGPKFVEKSVYVIEAIGPSSHDMLPSAVGPLNYTALTYSPRLSPRTTLAPPTTATPSTLSMRHCWETRIGQELTKLVIVDLVMTVAAIMLIDFFRGLFIRYVNPWWFWNLETIFPEYGEFKVAENVLHLANNQGMIWLGVFFAPLLPLINNLKLMILMYIRSWACMTCNVPARQIFRASRSSNFYLMLMLLMLFLCTLPVGYVIASKRPSTVCGPFQNHRQFYNIITVMVKDKMDPTVFSVLQYLASPGIIIPIIVLLLLIIYFLFSLVRGLREANNDLSDQLTHERTEEKKRIFELAGGKREKKRGSLFFSFGKKSTVTKPKPPAPPLKKTPTSSSEDDTSKVSLPRSITSIRDPKFVPSLGSVSEVDHSCSDQSSEEEAKEQKSTPAPLPPPKRTITHRLLSLFGMSGKKKYITRDDVETGTVEEKKELLNAEMTHSSSSSSSSSEESDDEEERTASFITASQGQDRSRSESRQKADRKEMDGTKRSGGESSASTSSSSATTHSQSSPYPATPHLKSPLLEVVRTSTSPSTSRRSPPPVPPHRHKEGEVRTGKQTHSPHRPSVLGDDTSTRPPSQDGSFRDDAHSSSQDTHSHMHSSYTHAMLSPIMGRQREMEESEEGSPDDLSPLLSRDSHPEGIEGESCRGRDRRDSYNEARPRPPCFRISSSPPKSTQSDGRHFELTLSSSPKLKRARRKNEKRAAHSQV